MDDADLCICLIGSTTIFVDVNNGYHCKQISPFKTLLRCVFQSKWQG